MAGTQPGKRPAAPKLTIGMAHHTDYHGLYFSLQSLRLHHPEAMRDVEIVVVDNSFGSAHSQMAGQLLNGTFAGRSYDPSRQVWVDHRPEPVQQNDLQQRGLAGVKVVTMEGAADTGTSATRERIFTEATAPAVLVMDCHVMFPPGVIHQLLQWYDTDAGDDLYSGPLLYDTLRGHSTGGPRDVTTHFDDIWRGQMWGTWGKAWRCKCGPDGVHLATVEKHAEGGSVVEFRALEKQVPVDRCHQCGEQLPELPWNAHQVELLKAGFYPLGERDNDPPFAIPGCGLGVFTCRKDAWLGFNEHARGFGGEELYIHEKFRQHGRQAICLPWLKWLHRFGRPDGVPYPLTAYNKVRNYVLEFLELGMSLDPVHEHFVLQGPLNQAQWEHLVDDPVENVEPPAEDKKCGGCGKNRRLNKAASLDAIYAELCTIKRDLNEHLPALRDLADKCERVTEISKRRESTVAMLSARPARLVSHQLEHDDQTLNRAIKYAKDDGVDVTVFPLPQGRSVSEIEGTELLLIDHDHRAAVLRQQLEDLAPKVSRFIVLHDTQTYGETGTDGGPGLLPAMRHYMQQNPQWSVISHSTDQHGLTVLGCRDEDKPPLPKAVTMAGNLGKALVGFIADGGKSVTEEQLEQRLLVCSDCPQRRNTRCAVCGCYLAAKAKLASQACPLGLWEKNTEAAEA